MLRCPVLLVRGLATCHPGFDMVARIVVPVLASSLVLVFDQQEEEGAGSPEPNVEGSRS